MLGAERNGEILIVCDSVYISDSLCATVCVLVDTVGVACNK